MYLSVGGVVLPLLWYLDKIWIEALEQARTLTVTSSLDHRVVLEGLRMVLLEDGRVASCSGFISNSV